MTPALFLVLLIIGLALALAALLAVIASILNQWRHSSHADTDELRKAGL
jgi:DNA-binding transcriptional regulator YdaS (Cro superfamily)